MQIEIDIEGLISRGIIDGVFNKDSLQKEAYNILKSDELQKILTEYVKTRVREIMSSESGRKQIDKSIIDTIVKSDKIQDEIEEILEGCECGEILEHHAETCLKEFISSEEGKKQIIDKVKEFLENYDIEFDDDFNRELSKWVSDILLIMMKDFFKRLKTSNIQ